MSTGILYLIPAPLGLGDIAWAIPPAVRQCIAGLGHFIVEHPKTARQFLKQVGCILPIQAIQMQLLDEHTHVTEFEKLLTPILRGNDTGLLSEAGCPAIADPGAGLVRLAHQKKYPDKTISRPLFNTARTDGLGVEWSTIRIPRLPASGARPTRQKAGSTGKGLGHSRADPDLH